MTIKEQQIQGKLDSERCEDGIAVTDAFIAVVDGSTSKTNLRIRPEMTNGKLCMRLICQYIVNMPAETSMLDFCKGITDVVADEYLKAEVDMERLKATPTDRMTASAVVYSDFHREIWMVGDCQAMVDGVIYDNPKPYEREIAEERASILLEAIAEGAAADDLRTDDIGRKAILPKLKAACREQNVSYPVVDGFTIPCSLVRVVKLGAGHHDIVLASDGYPLLKPTLRESEEELERLLTEDPLCIGENVATKGLAIGQRSFDDRAFVRFAI